jgi:hypothetical protein
MTCGVIRSGGLNYVAAAASNLNAAWRCDVVFDLYSIVVCDNRDRQALAFDLEAATPRGALAARTLAVLQRRQPGDQQ